MVYWGNKFKNHNLFPQQILKQKLTRKFNPQNKFFGLNLLEGTQVKLMPMVNTKILIGTQYKLKDL